MKRYLKVLIICFIIVGLPLGLFHLKIANDIRRLEVQDEYLDKMDQKFLAINQAVYSLEQLASAYEPTEAWRAETIKDLKAIEAEVQGFQTLNPPKGLEEVHKLYLEASEVYDVSSKEMASVLSELDQRSAINRIEIIRKGNEIFVRGSELEAEN